MKSFFTFLLIAVMLVMTATLAFELGRHLGQLTNLISES